MRVRPLQLAATLFWLVSLRSADAQSPMAIRNVGSDAPNAKAADAVAVNNPWFGSQVAHRFGQGDDFASNLLVSGQVVYPIDLGRSKWRLPVVGNIGGSFAESAGGSKEEVDDKKLNELLQSKSGATVGIYPYRAFELSDVLVLTIHAQASWKGNVLKTEADTSKTELVNQGKFGVGMEVLLGTRDDNSSPLSFSLTPTILTFSREQMGRVTGTKENAFTAVEGVLVLPLRTGMGMLFESVVAAKAKPTFRFGIMIAKD